MVTCIPVHLWHDLGRSWMLPLLNTLKNTPEGFNQVSEQLGMSSKVLQERLLVLEEHELVFRKKSSDKTQFTLTNKAQDLLKVWDEYVLFINKYYPNLPCGQIACKNCPQLK